ncbi:MAG: peptidoglycan-associated lipoprotein Pal [Gallionella sp.]
MKQIAVVLASLLFAACASTPKPASQAVEKGAPPIPSVTTATVSTADLESKKLTAEIQNLQQQSIYFELDKSIIGPEYRDVLQKQADFIKAHKNDIVTIQGNCDERGSAEYNLALGQRRAGAAQKNLELLGVPAQQINTISFGSEKPRLTCHEEKCWKENRRDDFIHTFD